MFTFRKAPEGTELGGSFHLLGPAINEILYLGKVITLFGMPELDSDYECMFTVAVAAEDEAGNKLILDVYHGPSGPAIGGFDTERSLEAAKELAELINAAEPSDYDWAGVYEDVPVEIKMGIRNGKPYHKESFPEDMDPEDFM